MRMFRISRTIHCMREPLLFLLWCVMLLKTFPTKKLSSLQSSRNYNLCGHVDSSLLPLASISGHLGTLDNVNFWEEQFHQATYIQMTSDIQTPVFLELTHL